MPLGPSPARLVVIPLAVAGLVGAFILGRVTAPADEPANAVDCSGSPRSGMDIDEQFGGSDRVAYFSQCDARAAQPETFGDEWGRINVYAAAAGDDVVAWWYQGCGTPEGIVEVGTDRPNNCGASDTTGSP